MVALKAFEFPPSSHNRKYEKTIVTFATIGHIQILAGVAKRFKFAWQVKAPNLLPRDFTIRYVRRLS